MDLDCVPVHNHAKMNNLGQYPEVMPSLLVGNPYIMELKTLLEYLMLINELYIHYIALHCFLSKQERCKLILLLFYNSRKEFV